MKIGWMWVAAVLVAAIQISCSSSGGNQEIDVVDVESRETTGEIRQSDTPVPENTPTTPPSVQRLSARGKDIVNENGEVVVLKGVNLGSWLFHETWIPQTAHSLSSQIHVLGRLQGLQEHVDPILVELGSTWGGEWYLDQVRLKLAERVGDEPASVFADLVRQYMPTLYDDADLALRRKLVERFGEEGRDDLMNTFQDAWITEKDLEWLAEQGFNLVRIPTGFRTLVLGPDLEFPEELRWNERALLHLDLLLDWCETHGLYAVIDIQEAPGRQNNYSGESILYTDPKMQALTIELWTMLSSRYRDRNVVAAYSLLAEPYSAPTPAARDELYDRIIKAIRNQDDDHLVVVHDGFKGMESLVDPGHYQWTNVIYSTHIFNFDADSYAVWESLVNVFYRPVFQHAQAEQNVPYFIGSFATRRHADWAYDAARLLVSFFNEEGYSWAIWTFKMIDDPVEKELWDRESSYGVLGRLHGEFQRPDPFDDNFETLMEKFEAYRHLDLRPNERLLSILKEGL